MKFLIVLISLAYLSVYAAPVVGHHLLGIDDARASFLFTLIALYLIDISIRISRWLDNQGRKEQKHEQA